MKKKTIEVQVIDADTAEEYAAKLEQAVSEGWGLVSEHRERDTNGGRWYSATLKYDHGKHIELTVLRETAKTHTSQIQSIFRWIEQQRTSSSMDDTQLINPYTNY